MFISTVLISPRCAAMLFFVLGCFGSPLLLSFTFFVASNNDGSCVVFSHGPLTFVKCGLTMLFGNVNMIWIMKFLLYLKN